MISRGLLRTIAIAVILVGGLALVVFLLPDRSRRGGVNDAANRPAFMRVGGTGSSAEALGQAMPHRLGNTPLTIPGVRRPLFVSAGEAGIDDESAVVGVSIKGEDRAYLVTALSTVDGHVVNDIVQECPVTVTYCDQRDCARVLTALDSQEALAVGLGGWMDQKMLLLLGTKRIAQDATDLPFEDLPFEKTTWGRWKAAHPESKLYLGRSEVRRPGEPTPDDRTDE